VTRAAGSGEKPSRIRDVIFERIAIAAFAASF
jgi:hypothetical protein